MNQQLSISTSPSLVAEVILELSEARAKHPGRFNSAHEAYAVILEELDEFKVEVWKRGSRRDLGNMRRELIQIAAMAIRTIEDLDLRR